MDKVSIITPVYGSNRQLFDRTVKGITEQLSNNFEWIVVFDGDTKVVDNSVIGRLPFPLKWSILGNNYGPSVARNVGFQMSDGDIITYLDMGDEISPKRVDHLLYLYNEYGIELAFDSYNIIQDDKEYFLNHIAIMDSLKEDAFMYLDRLQRQNISIPLGVSHLRLPFVNAGGFQRGIVCGEDGILWRRMAETLSKSMIMFTDHCAGNYYVSQTGQSRTQRRFEMGGFAFDGSKNDNGKYLDDHWFDEYNSRGLYDNV